MKLDYEERDRRSVLRDLDSPDEEVRRLAVERADALPVDQAIARLVECLGDASWRVRKTAVERLVACGDPVRVGAALIGALSDGENPGRRNAAVEALIDCGSRAMDSLLPATASPDPDVRKLVVDALAGIADPRSVGVLLERLEDPDPNVRAAAADALGALGGEEAARALRRVAASDAQEQLVRFTALHSLASLEAPVRAIDLAGVLADPVLRPAALATLGTEDEEQAVAVLLKGLEDRSRAVREAAMRSLLRLLSRVDGARAEALSSQIREAARAFPRLLESAVARLDEADLSTRLVLVQFVGLLGDESSVVPMLFAGRDEALHEVVLATLEALGETAEAALDAAWDRLDPDARRDACTLFGRTHGERGAGRLLVALDSDDAGLRAAAARSIGRRRLASALDTLVRRLSAAAGEDDYEGEEEIAALTEALIALAGPTPDGEPHVTERAIVLLSDCLAGSGESVRHAVATVLGRIGRRQDVEIVELLLKDPSALVRRAAVNALARLEPGTAAEPLHLALADESPAVRIAAAGALGASDSDDVLDDLRRLAEDSDPSVRAAAVHALVLRFLGSPDPERAAAARRVLEAALRDEAPVALAGMEALRRVGGEDVALAASVFARSEPELLLEAVRCLGAHADRGALDALLPLVSHPDWSTRAEAIQVLADRRVAKAVPSILRRLEVEQDEFVRGVMLRALERLEG